MKRIISLIVMVGSLLTGCRDDKYVEVTYMVENTTDVEVTMRIDKRMGSTTVVVEPHGSATICEEKGVRGLYMITYLFEKVEVIVGGKSVRTYDGRRSEGFFDMNRWDDVAESLPEGQRDVWEDVCTYRITEEDIKACELL